MGCAIIFIITLIVTMVISYEVVQNKTDYDKRIDDEQQEDISKKGGNTMNNYISEKEYSHEVDKLRENRVKVSFYKYGTAAKNFGRGYVDALKTEEKCIEKYNETGNKEYLLDAMNYLMFEFMYPQRKGAFFKATDSKESAGIVGISAKEMEDLKNEDY